MSSDFDMRSSSEDESPIFPLSDTDSISVTEAEMGKIRENLAEQQKCIETFIKMHENGHKMSESFAVVRSLLSVFKSSFDNNSGLVDQISDLNESNQQLQAEIESLKEQNDSFLLAVSTIAGTDIISLSQVVDFLRTTMAEKQRTEQQSALLNTQIKMIQSKSEDVNAEESLEIAHLKSRAELAEREASQLSDQLTALQENNSSLEQSIVSREETENGYKYEIRKLKAMIQKQEKMHKRLEQRNAELLKENEMLKGEQGSLSLEKDDLRQSLTASEGEKETLAKSLKQYKKQMKLMKSETSTLTTKLEESEQELSKNKQHEEELLRENKKLKKIIKQAAKEQQKLEGENSQLIIAVEHLRQEIDRVKLCVGYSSEFLDEGTSMMSRSRRGYCRPSEDGESDERFLKKKMARLQRELDSIRAELMMLTD